MAAKNRHDTLNVALLLRPGAAKNPGPDSDFAAMLAQSDLGPSMSFRIIEGEAPLDGVDILHVVGLAEPGHALAALASAKAADIATIVTPMIDTCRAPSGAEAYPERAVKRIAINILARLAVPSALATRDARNRAVRRAAEQLELIGCGCTIIFASTEDLAAARALVDLRCRPQVAVVDGQIDTLGIGAAYRLATQPMPSENNSVDAWEDRFRSGSWAAGDHRLQTALFAVGFALTGIDFGEPASVLDFGSALGDSIPVLRMRFPGSALHFHDQSPYANQQASLRYGTIASHFDPAHDRPVDLVYCSNVVEHIVELRPFLDMIRPLSQHWIVLQAPWNQRHPDGSRITPDSPLDDHVRTIDEELVAELAEDGWTCSLTSVPWAWPGQQVLLVLDKQAPGR